MNVLLIRAGALGDVLLLRPVIAALHAARCRVTLVAPATSASVLLGPGPSEIVTAWPWDGPEMSALLAGEARAGPLVQALRAADVVLAYTRSESVLAALRPHTRQIVGHDPAPPAGTAHAGEWLARPLSALGIPPPSSSVPSLVLDEEVPSVRPLLERLPPRFLALHPGSGSPLKTWPTQRFLDLASLVAGDRPWLLVRGPAEQTALRSLPPNAVLADSLPLRRLAAALRAAGLFVGNDSGVSHLAAAAAAPTLAIFGPTDPSTWAPLGPCVRTLRAPGGNLASLSVEAVRRTAEALMTDTGP